MDKLDSFGFAKFSESLLKHCFGQYQSEREREREMIVFGHMAMWLKKDEQKKNEWYMAEPVKLPTSLGHLFWGVLSHRGIPNHPTLDHFSLKTHWKASFWTWCTKAIPTKADTL